MKILRTPLATGFIGYSLVPDDFDLGDGRRRAGCTVHDLPADLKHLDEDRLFRALADAVLSLRAEAALRGKARTYIAARDIDQVPLGLIR